MARIAGVDLPRDKKIQYALPYIFGIGPSNSVKILAETGISPDARVRDLRDAEVARLRQVMWEHVGLIRGGEGLKLALTEIEDIARRLDAVAVRGGGAYNLAWQDWLNLENQATAAWLIARSALERTESRGGHTRSDYPDSDERQAREQIVIKREGDRMAVRREAQPPLPAELMTLIKEGK